MTRQSTVRGMLRRYGSPVRAEDVETEAILRPLQYKNIAEKKLPSEYADGLHLLYTGPADKKLTVGGTVEASGLTYTVLRADTAVLGGKELYVWAVLRPLPSEKTARVTLETAEGGAALAENCTVLLSRSCGTVVSWGEEDPSGLAQGAVSYMLTLQNVQPIGGTDPAGLSDFSVVIRRGDETDTYSGCCIRTLTDLNEPLGTRRYNMEVLALARTRTKEAQSSGT